MKSIRFLIAGVIILGYGIWVYTGPLANLETQYGDSGLTWGILVFGLMIPYAAYFIFNLVQTRRKRKTDKSAQREGED